MDDLFADISPQVIVDSEVQRAMEMCVNSIFDEIDIKEGRWKADGRRVVLEAIGDMVFLQKGNEFYFMWREIEKGAREI